MWTAVDRALRRLGGEGRQAWASIQRASDYHVIRMVLGEVALVEVFGARWFQGTRRDALMKRTTVLAILRRELALGARLMMKRIKTARGEVEHRDR